MNTFYMIPPKSSSFTIMALAIAIPFLISVFFGVNFFMLKNVKFNVNNNELRISGGLYRKVLKLDEIDVDSITLIDLDVNKEYTPVFKKNGIGLPGIKEGWFKLKNGEKALLFLTDKKKVVYLQTTRGYSLLMSVNEPEKFINSLKYHK